jgi:hypothetical protein
LPAAARADYSDRRSPIAATRAPIASGRIGARSAPYVGTRVIFDISDLVYYIGRHPNLTGIQRVQSSIVLSIVAGKLLPQSAVIFLVFNARSRRWNVIPTDYLIRVLEDLFLPVEQRPVSFATDEVRDGILPGAIEFNGAGLLDDGNPSVLCLLGAAWVQRDYFHRVAALKRRFGTKFVMVLHDLIPVYARETCDQDTARVFDDFLRRALRHVDHVLSISENTAKDLRRFARSMSVPVPPITVTRNGSSFEEFLPKGGYADAAADRLPERFVLFVATVEGRKNHRLILDIWRRMLAEGDDPPHLVCVGRVVGDPNPLSRSWSKPTTWMGASSCFRRSATRISACCTAAACLPCSPRCMKAGACRSVSLWPRARSASAAIVPRSPKWPGSSGRTWISKTPISHTGWSASW